LARGFRLSAIFLDNFYRKRLFYAQTFDLPIVVNNSLCDISIYDPMKKSCSKNRFTAAKIFSLSFVLLTNFSCEIIREKQKPLTKVSTVAGIVERFGEPFGVAVRGDEIFVSDGETGKIWRISRDGSMRIFAENFDTPSQITFDKNGDLIVADSGSHTIKKIKQTGEIETIAGIENKSGFADGDASHALFNAPVGIAVSENKIFVADTYNDKIRVIENGKVSTLAGGERGFADSEFASSVKFDTPCGIALKDGKIIVADAGNLRLRVVEDSGKTSTLAGNGVQDSFDGNLFEASFVAPLAVAVGNFGEIYVSDGNSIRVIGRRFFPTVETISGSERGFSDGSLGRSKFNRPSSLAVDENGNLFVADSENQVLRVFTGVDLGKETSRDESEKLKISAAEFRRLGEPRWPFDPPGKKREIAGTVGEIRGDVSADEEVWFHNGLDISGGYGEPARFVRAEKVLLPIAVQNFSKLRELIRMPTLAYIHIRIGRDKDNKIFNDKRFQFLFEPNGKLKSVRVPRGAKFEAGERLGTLNSMNHVHLIAGRSGAEMNALDALVLPGISDVIAPVIEQISLFDQNWKPVTETKSQNSRIMLSGNTRIVARAFDRMDGNAERRRLGVYRLGYQILNAEHAPLTEEKTTISFAFLPDAESVRLVYADGSKSGATGETVFNYIVTNEIDGENAAESFFDASTLQSGNYILRVFAADYFGNKTVSDIEFTK
jgi:sugar lactone lactonase YvrE